MDAVDPNATAVTAANATATATDAASPPMQLNVVYTVFEVLVAVAAVVGNALVMLVFHRERRLRRRTNYYIVSLAAADFLVGLLGIPFAILASVGLPRDLHACLFTVSLLVVLCTISIFCLVAVSVDRYWAILHPMGYSRNVRTKTAIGIIGVCWLAGSLVGFLPLFGWHEPAHGVCLFTKVMDYNYLVFLYFATIVFPALLLACFYVHIYRVVLKQLRRIVTMNPMRGAGPGGAGGGGGGGTMLRMLGPIKKSEVKATQNLSIIVLFFILCWFPLYTINCIQAFRRDWKVDPTLMEFCIVLSHLNSAGNPLLYAYHLRDFRAALKSFLWKLLGMQEEPAGGGGGGGGFGCGPGARSVGSQLGLAAAALGGGAAGRGVGGPAGGGGGGAWVSAVGAAPSLRRSAPALHMLLVPPSTPAATTAHSSMTSIASSMGSVHQAAAAPALPALAPPATPPPPAAHHAHSAYRVEVVGGTMSTVAEASQSEEEPSTTPASAGPDAPPVAPAAASPSPSPPPSPARLSPACGDGPLSLGLDAELSDGDDDVFVPASAPNAAAIGAAGAGARTSGSACEYRARHLAPARRVASAPRAKHRVLRPPSDELEAADGEVDAGAPDFSDDRAELSPRAAKTPVITNGNGELRRVSREDAEGGAAPPVPAAAPLPGVVTAGGGRKLSPLKAVSDFLLGAKSHSHSTGRRKDAAAEDAVARDDAVDGRDGTGPPTHRNGSAVHVAQRDA